MPQTITNPEILALITSNVTELKSINDSQEQLNKRIEELHKENQKFVDAMNAEYGWGNWQDVDTTNNTFIPRDEFMDKWYVIHNPALKPVVELDDVVVTESGDYTLDDLSDETKEDLSVEEQVELVNSINEIGE